MPYHEHDQHIEKVIYSLEILKDIEITNNEKIEGSKKFDTRRTDNMHMKRKKTSMRTLDMSILRKRLKT